MKIFQDSKNAYHFYIQLTLGPFEFSSCFRHRRFFIKKVKSHSTKIWRWIFPSRYVDDGKKSNSQSSRIITKRKNVDDENSHSNGPIFCHLKLCFANMIHSSKWVNNTLLCKTKSQCTSVSQIWRHFSVLKTGCTSDNKITMITVTLVQTSL